MDRNTHFHRGEHQIAEPHDAHEFRFSGSHLFHNQWVLHFEIPGRRWHFSGGALHDGTKTCGLPSNWGTRSYATYIHKHQGRCCFYSTIGIVMKGSCRLLLCSLRSYILRHYDTAA